ncbi:unannotated protein [freshwater metagenome]|uniref:Unannotated protein n=1 Tax=freshwater metagenome TaxID=449393 RepID=A0A6J7CQ00_9ZZZZ
MEWAIHWLEVVIDSRPRDFTCLVANLVEMHWRKHPVLVPGKVSRRLKQILLRDVGRMNEFVPALLVAGARIVLHRAPDNSTLRMEHRKARADFLGEREQIELCAETTMVALVRLFESLRVVAQFLF